MHKDLISNLQTAVALEAQVLTVSADGADVDRKGANGNVMYLANVGLSGDTLSGSVMIELEIEESDDGISYTDVANTDLSNSVTGTNPGTFAVIDLAGEDQAIYKTEYRGSKRYSRVVANLTGTHTNGTPVGVESQIGSPQLAPTD